MKGVLSALSILVWALALSGCSSSCPPCGGEGGLAAVVGGEGITIEELDGAARDRLARIDTEIYQAKRQVLDALIEEKLIASAAKKKGMGVDEYMTQEIDSAVPVPTEDEARALYDARKGATTQSYEEVRDDLLDYLSQNRKAQARAELLAKLREGAVIEIKLSPPRMDIDIGDVPTVGDDGAKVTVVEFSDYQCPFCKRVRPTVWRIVDEYKDDLRYAFMDFPLSFHRDAKKAHEAARCAGEQGKYYEYNRKVFENQVRMKVDDLRKYAKQLNLDMERFNQCLDSGKHAATVEKMIEKGTKAGVAGTPAFFINGIMLSGARPYESFKEIIDTEIKR